MGQVRRATQIDVEEIVAFLGVYHPTSNLSDIPFDKGTMTLALNYYLHTPKHVVFVYVNEDKKICGVLMGNIEPFVFNAKRHWATDMIFIADKGGSWLLKKFISWAKLYKIDRIIMGVSSGNERSGALYQAMGMEHIGGMYAMQITEAAS